MKVTQKIEDVIPRSPGFGEGQESQLTSYNIRKRRIEEEEEEEDEEDEENAKRMFCVDITL